MPSTKLFVTDQQRSVLSTLEVNHSPKTIAYSPYGHRPADYLMLSFLGFNGEFAEPITGHYLLGNGNRAFNPVLMRFNSPDNLSPFNKGGLNQFTYCLGDPINRSDPNGHISFKSISKMAILVNRMQKNATATQLIPRRARMKYLDDIMSRQVKNQFNGRYKSDLLAARSVLQENSKGLNLQSMAGVAVRNNEIPYSHTPRAIQKIIDNNMMPEEARFIVSLESSPQRGHWAFKFDHLDHVADYRESFRHPLMSTPHPSAQTIQIAHRYRNRLKTYPAAHAQLRDEYLKLREMT